MNYQGLEKQSMPKLFIHLFSHLTKFSLLTLLCICLSFGPVVQPSVRAEAADASHTPVRLLIPRLKVDAPIEAVGKDANGDAGVPQQSQDVAWYNLGPAPGEPGNAVIAGHLDDKVGPAVFAKLGQLKVDDTVIVVDKAKVQHTFKVIEVAAYPYQKAPLNKIFGFDLEHDLNLITCTGRWNPKTHTYSQRLVVYTRLVAN